jgi:hypothetical protein
MKLEDCFPDKKNQAAAYWFPNNGVIVDRLPENLYNLIMTEIEKIQSDFENQEKYNNRLVGHIQHQFDLTSCIPILNDYIVDLAEKHAEYFNVQHLIEILPDQKLKTSFKLETLWINFQKKHEFNPMHVHTGAYSFVIWMKIPYNIEDEQKLFADMNTFDRAPSNFNFYTTDILGRIRDHTVNVDKSKEGCIILFPAELDHSVNPFYTSDDYRISISGNVYIKIDK